MQQDDKTISATAIDMLTIANEYCYFLEHLEGKTKDELLIFTQKILPLLYLKGSLLPTFEPEYPEASERFVTEENWEAIFNILRDILGTDDEFWVIDPLYINETEPINSSISEHLCDIYQDLKDFILLYQRNTHAARENAMSDCAKLFAAHWGFRVGNILGRIHYLLHNEADEYSGF